MSWKSVKELHGLDFAVCGNNNTYSNNIFSVSNLRCFSKIDLSKNEWTKLFDGNKEINSHIKPLIWFENNPFVMYCLHYNKYTNSYFGYFDIRARSKKWQKIHDLQFINDQTGGIECQAFG